MDAILKKLEESAKANSLEILNPFWNCGAEKILRAEEYANSAYALRRSEAEKLALIATVRVLLEGLSDNADNEEYTQILEEAKKLLTHLVK